MKKSITISISEPCHEDWAKMTPTEKGKFCNSCEKEVFDFSKTSDEELVKRLHRGDSLCGRFQATQLNRELKLERKSKYSIAGYAASLLVPATLLSGLTASATNKMENKTYTSVGIGSLSKTKMTIANHVKNDSAFKKVQNDSLITVKGVITDENNLPLPGASIIVKGKAQGTQTDFDGKYELTTSPNEILVVSYLSYETKHITLSNIDQTIDFKMVPDIELMGDVVIVAGGISVEEKPKKCVFQPFSYEPALVDEERDAAREKQKKAYKNTLAFLKIKAEREKEARQQKRAAKKTK